MRVTMERVPCDADAVAREVEAAGLPPEFAGTGAVVVNSVAGDLADLWIHMAGPVLGALAGVAIYAFLRDARDSTVAAVPTALTENQEAAR